MIVLAAWLSTKINSPRLAALLGVVLLLVAIYGVSQNSMPLALGVIISIVGVINLMRLLPQPDDDAVAKAKAAMGSPA